MEPFLARYEGIRYSFVLEVKYLKAGFKPQGEGALDPKIHRVVQEAKEQLRQYAMDEKFQKSVARTTAIKLVLVFSGHEPVYIGEC